MFSCSSVLLFFSSDFFLLRSYSPVPLFFCSVGLPICYFFWSFAIMLFLFLCLPVLIFVRSSILVFFLSFQFFSDGSALFFCNCITLLLCPSVLQDLHFIFFSFFSYGSPVFVSFFIFATMLDCSSVHLFFCSSSPPSFFFMYLTRFFSVLLQVLNLLFCSPCSVLQVA